MKTFNTEDEAYEYAETLGKYDYDKALVNGSRTFITSTDIPIERRFRYPIEEIVRDFCEMMELTDEDTIDDMVNEIGAEMCSELVKMIEKHTGIKIISAYLCY